ncbi:MAG: competence protein ComE, partial [Merismopedia sp. SIO2A8]|nr:competence protein ComE [Merismopedia sp. SIO2A8]
NQQCQYDDGNMPWPRPLTTVGTPQLAKGDKLHHKFAIVDQGTTITGSQNWSASANHRNDELIVIIKNKVVSAHFVREFSRLYGHANFGVPTWLKSTMQDQQTRCQSERTVKTTPPTLVRALSIPTPP